MWLMICLHTEYCMVDAVHFGGIDRKSVREAANSPMFQLSLGSDFFFEGPFLSEEKFTLENRTGEPEWLTWLSG